MTSVDKQGLLYQGSAQALHQPQEIQTFLLMLSNTLAPLNNADEVQRTAARVLAEHLNASNVYFKAGTENPLGEREDVLWLGPDVNTCSPLNTAERAHPARLGVAAWAVFPIVRGGQRIASLVVHHTQPHSWTQPEIAVIRATAERTWAEVERARAETARRASDARLQVALDAAEMGTFVWYPEQDRGECDARTLALYGLAPDESLNHVRGITELILPDDAHLHHQAVLRALDPRSGGLFRSECRIRRPVDGAVRWVAHVGQTQFEGSPPKAISITGVCSDITERKQSEATLREVKEQKSFLLKLADTLRRLSNPMAVQAEAARMLGEHLSANQVHYGENVGGRVVIHQGYGDGLPPMVGSFSPLDFGERLVATYRAGRTAVCNDVTCDTTLSDAEKRVIIDAGFRSYIAVPLVKDGVLSATLAAHCIAPRHWSPKEVALVEEVAERTWGAVERARAEAASVKANQAKDEFLATLSHELRTPLAPILLWGRALLAGNVPMKDFGRAVESIVRSAESQSRLIEDLLDLMRLQSGKLTLEKRPVPVENIARAAREVIRPTADAKGVTLQTELEPGLRDIVLDADRFQQVLWNLLSNAVKFTPSGGQVSLRFRKHAGHLEVHVSDSGQGIAPDFLPRLFQRFSQANMGERRQHAGLGIGLALCRSLVELHGGTVNATSDGEGKGAVFTVRVPWVEAAATPSDTHTATCPSAPSLSGLSVLLIEDDVHTREVMQWTLEHTQAEVVAVGTGFEALARLKERHAMPPSVIVCDIGLPEMNGYELIEAINRARRAEGKKPIPACAVSAYARDEDRQRAIEAGFERYIAKPVSAEVLVATVNELGNPH